MKSAHTFRQSWAKDFLMCPERGRRSAFDPAWDSPDSDATVLGTAVHEYMEGRLHGLGHGEALHDAMAWLDTRLEAGDFQRVQIKGDDTLRSKLEGCAGRLDVSVVPHVPPVDPSEIVRHFDVPLAPDGSIRLSGTWDARDIHGRLWDWKTAARLDRYVGWEIDRWYVQPTFYATAARLQDLVDAHGEAAALEIFWGGDEWEIPFTFAVVTKTPEPIADTFDTTRTHGHAAWLLEQLRSFVAMREGMSVDVPWPKNDQHALCSQKWCPAWGTCKGQHIR